MVLGRFQDGCRLFASDAIGVGRNIRTKTGAKDLSALVGG